MASATTRPATDWGEATRSVVRALLTTARWVVLSRRLTVPLDDGELELTVTRVAVRALSVGQSSEVRLKVRDIRWPSGYFERATIRAHDVHIQPSIPPVLVASPVDITVQISSDALGALLRRATRRLDGDIDADGVARLRWARAPGSGHLEVAATLGETTLWLHPKAIVRGRHRLALPARTPAYPVRLPENNITVTAVELIPGAVRVSGTLPEWRMDVPRTRWDGILGQLMVPVNLAWSVLGR